MESFVQGNIRGKKSPPETPSLSSLINRFKCVGQFIVLVLSSRLQQRFQILELVLRFKLEGII